MPSNSRFVHSVIWTAAFICLTRGAPAQRLNLLEQFFSDFTKRHCSVLDKVVFPIYKSGDNENFINSLTVPLEACLADDGPEMPICNEALDAMYNITTCRKDSEALSKALQWIKPINITVQIDDVCEGFFEDQNIFIHDQKCIAFKLTDKQMCPLVCRGEAMVKVCSFLLWSYRVQASIQETLETVVSSDKTSSGSQNEKPSTVQNVPNETRETTNHASAASEVIFQEKKNSNIMPQNVASAKDQNKKSKLQGKKSSLDPSQPTSFKPSSGDDKSLSLDESQDSQAKQRVSVLDAEHDAKPSSEQMKGNTTEDHTHQKSNTDTITASTISITEKPITIASNSKSKNSGSIQSISPVHDTYDVVNKVTKHSSKSFTSVTDGLKKSAENLVQESYHSDNPNKNIETTVQGNSLDAIKKIEDLAVIGNSVPDGSNTVTHSTKSSEAVSAVKNQGTIPESDSIGNSDSGDEIDLPPLLENSLGIVTSEKGTSRKDLHSSEITESVKKTDSKPETPTAGIVPLQGMDENSPPTDEENYNDVHLGQSGGPGDNMDSMNDPIDIENDDQSSESQANAADSGARNNAADNGAGNKAADNGADNNAADNGAGSNAADDGASSNAADDRASSNAADDRASSNAADDGASSNVVEDSQISISRVQATFPEQEDTHFFFYFITIVIFVIGGYVLFHNKQKIFALIIEGRHERRRRSGASYRKLETK